MDTNKYEVLLNVVDRGSYSKACEDLGYTLSGISKIIKSMEAEIGVPLLNRTNKGVTLTAEGEYVLPRIRELIRCKDILEEEFAQIRGVESGRIRIGTFPTAGFIWVPKLIHKMKTDHPNIEVEILEENNIHLLESWLNQGVIDVGIFSRQPWHTYDWFGLHEDPYVALLPEDHPLAAREVVPVAELYDKDLILFRSQDGLDQDVRQFISYLEMKVKPKYTSNSDFTVIRMVEKTGSIALLPKLIADYAVDYFRVVCRPTDVRVVRQIGYAVKDASHLSPAVRQMLQYVRA